MLNYPSGWGCDLSSAVDGLIDCSVVAHDVLYRSVDRASLAVRMLGWLITTVFWWVVGLSVADYFIDRSVLVDLFSVLVAHAR